LRYCPDCGREKELHPLDRIPTEGGVIRQRRCMLVIAPDPDPRTGERRPIRTYTADRAGYAEMAVA